MKLKFVFVLLLSTGFIGCGGAQIKQRKEQREKIVQTAKLYCDFVNGEVYSADVEVQLNLEIAKHCDSEKSLTITAYKNPAENRGVLYCCGSNTSKMSKVEVEANKSESKKEKE